MEVSFLGRENLTLFDELLPELGGIAAWALRGLNRLHEQGQFTMPEISKREAKFIAESFSPLSCFVEDCCTFDKKKHVAFCNDTYEVYRNWCLVNHEGDMLRPKTFVAQLKDLVREYHVSHGTQRYKGRHDRGFKGLTVTPVTGGTSTARAFTVVPK
jgi:phage/plasmid-associated DNA primase